MYVKWLIVFLYLCIYVYVCIYVYNIYVRIYIQKKNRPAAPQEREGAAHREAQSGRAVASAADLPASPRPPGDHVTLPEILKS